MNALIEVLPSILRTAGKSDEINLAVCIVAWNHVAGEGLRRNAIPVRVEDGTLIVAVSDQIWQKQLQTMLGLLKFRVNAVLGTPLIKLIDLRVEPETIEKSRESHLKQKNLRREPPQELLFPAGRIQDPHLRELFLGAATTCLNRRENSEPNS